MISNINLNLNINNRLSLIYRLCINNLMTWFLQLTHWPLPISTMLFLLNSLIKIKSKWVSIFLMYLRICIKYQESKSPRGQPQYICLAQSSTCCHRISSTSARLIQMQRDWRSPYLLEWTNKDKCWRAAYRRIYWWANLNLLTNKLKALSLMKWTMKILISCTSVLLNNLSHWNRN